MKRDYMQSGHQTIIGLYHLHTAVRPEHVRGGGALSHLRGSSYAKRCPCIIEFSSEVQHFKLVHCGFSKSGRTYLHNLVHLGTVIDRLLQYVCRL